MTNEEREALIAQGWTPPEVVDPDIAEAWYLVGWRGWSDNHELVLSAIKRGRELERAVMGNPIPEQIQEVTPPEPVNLDLAEAEIIARTADVTFSNAALMGIKRGRTKAPGPQAGSAGYRDWHDITHHAILTPPEEK